MAATLMASTDRIFELEVIDGTLPKATTGMVDVRLFKGGNKFHIAKSPEYNFWSYYYDDGSVPAPLRCNFTNFTMAFKHADTYFKARNLNLKEIDG